jgi:hypothetical protein
VQILFDVLAAVMKPAIACGLSTDYPQASSLVGRLSILRQFHPKADIYTQAAANPVHAENGLPALQKLIAIAPPGIDVRAAFRSCVADVIQTLTESWRQENSSAAAREGGSQCL